MACATAQPQNAKRRDLTAEAETIGQTNGESASKTAYAYGSFRDEEDIVNGTIVNGSRGILRGAKPDPGGKGQS